MEDPHVTDESFQEFDSINETFEEEYLNSEIKKHVCCHDKCDKSFTRLNRLIQHQRVHTGERPYICLEGNCGKSYARQSHLNRHFAQTHNLERTPADVVTCEFEGCYRTFVSKTNLKRHVAQIHKAIMKKYPCAVYGCNKTFSKRFQLRAHAYEHKGVEPFQCHIEKCKKKFKQKSHLLRHLKSHAGYTCKVEGCTLVFDIWSQLRNHMAHQHKTIEKQCHDETSDIEVARYACHHDDCPRMYSNYSNLKHHIDVCHTKSKIFKCKDCVKTFASRQKLQIHAKMHNTTIIKEEVCKTSRKVSTTKESLQLSEICDDFKHLNNHINLKDPFVALDRISLPINPSPKLLSEEHQLAHKLRRLKRRIKKNFIQENSF